ncbi:hypothetical protein [Methylocaldum sp.]|uniref:hypothetical protein n=1 Tax=Methylocaldum sp. TaxID=1969727 RepID=UPI002D55C582|nr:hypothetical protein [Methylocaldum sp.]HYE36299.1 hypothetical protein [Methylocaldum sp.]
MKPFFDFEHFSAQLFKPSDSLAYRHGNSVPFETGKAYFWLGVILLASFALQYGFGWTWRWLAELQTHEGYKQLSGGFLGLFIAHQWRLTARRTKPDPTTMRQDLSRHKRWGALAPLFFYAHAQQWGYAYLSALSAVFFAVFAMGLLHERLLRFRKVWLSQAWVVGHVVLATALLALIAYHAYVAFSYE